MKKKKTEKMINNDHIRSMDLCIRRKSDCCEWSANWEWKMMKTEGEEEEVDEKQEHTKKSLIMCVTRVKISIILFLTHTHILSPLLHIQIRKAQSFSSLVSHSHTVLCILGHFRLGTCTGHTLYSKFSFIKKSVVFSFSLLLFLSVS